MNTQATDQEKIFTVLYIYLKKRLTSRIYLKKKKTLTTQ